MKQQFQAFRSRRDTLTMIDQANKIIDEYQQQGFQLTLRQLYYQFVSRDLLENTNQKYKQLGSVISDARMAGLICPARRMGLCIRNRNARGRRWPRNS